MQYKKVVQIEQERADELQRLLDFDSEEFAESGAVEDYCYFSHIILFDDRMWALIEVCSGQNNCWVDAQLMLPNGAVVYEMQPGEEFLGEYAFAYDGREYLVVLEVSEEPAKSKWKEIRSGFFDEEEKKLYIDGWKTGKDDEEGKVLAKIDEEGNVEYLDEKAKEDPYAKEVIIAAVSEMKSGVHGGL